MTEPMQRPPLEQAALDLCDIIEEFGAFAFYTETGRIRTLTGTVPKRPKEEHQTYAELESQLAARDETIERLQAALVDMTAYRDNQERAKDGVIRLWKQAEEERDELRKKLSAEEEWICSWCKSRKGINDANQNDL